MKAPVRAGDLRHRVAIEAALRTGDGGGGAEISWSEVATVWAAIWPRTADEFMSADRIAGKASHDVWLRYRDDVVPAMRLRAGARVFNILGAIDVEDRRRWLKCPCEEIDL